MARACVYLLTWKYAAGVYVGATTNFKKRRAWHRRHFRQGDWPNWGVAAAAMVHGFPQCTVLEDVPAGPGLPDRLAQAERYWIDAMRFKGEQVLNVLEPDPHDYANGERSGSSSRERPKAGLPFTHPPQAELHRPPLEEGGGFRPRAPAAAAAEREALRVR